MANKTKLEATQETKTQEAGGVLGAFGVNGSLLIAQLINFGVVVLVLWRWVYKPLLKLLDERTRKIQAGLEFSKEATKQVEGMRKEKERLLNDARLEARQILKDTTTQAENVKHEKLQQAEAEVAKLIETGRQLLHKERDETFKTLRQDIARLVTAATEKIIANLDAETRGKLIKQAIKEVEEA